MRLPIKSQKKEVRTADPNPLKLSAMKCPKCGAPLLVRQPACRSQDIKCSECDFSETITF